MIKYGQAVCSLNVQSNSISRGQRSLDGMRARIILSSLGLWRGLIKNAWLLIAKINPGRVVSLQKIKKKQPGGYCSYKSI